MRRRPSLLLQVLTGVLGAAALFIGFTLPPRAASLGAANSDPRVVFGAYHIHTSRSDGTGTIEQIAAAAARAGLRFIVLTDHGDGTRTPEPPQYRHGVLCIDAAEIGTSAGHVVTLGLGQPAPYPLAGEPRDVLEDIHRLGGWAVVAHPDSPKPELRWRGWNVPYDGVEWLNVDSEWRDESGVHLAGTVARYLVRPPETIASLFQRPAATLRRWDNAARLRPIPAIAALDAHARIPWRNRRDPAQDGTLAAAPGYLQMFRTVAQAVVLDESLSGDGSRDAATVLSALRAGRTYSAITALATPASLDFQALAAGRTVRMGESAGPSGTDAVFHARTNDPVARVVLLHNGIEVAAGRGQLSWASSLTDGPYRVEAYRPATTLPWLLSNPIYGGEEDPVPATDAPELPVTLRYMPLPSAGGWAVERNATSTGTAAADGGATRFAFALGPGVALDQFAALVSSIGEAWSAEGFDRVQFTVRADHPMRLSVQLRLPGSEDRRWRYSAYADQTPRTIVAPLEQFQPVNRATSQRPIVARVRSVLFVVDTLNTRPSTTGSLWISNAALGVGRADR